MTAPAPPPAFFVIGGNLPPDATCYVPRRADDELFAHLSAGEYCHVLNSSQMGKSSLMVRAAERLHAAGAAVAVIDLTAIGRNVTLEQWYASLLYALGNPMLGLGRGAELDAFWDAQSDLSPAERWFAALREVVMPTQRGLVVVFIDEIGATRGLPFPADEFFAAIRACYNRRARDPDGRRLVFCLIGAVAPADLIADPSITPFNVGQLIGLDDFTLAEASHLAGGLGGPGLASERLLARILNWTGGHPYLTQSLCAALAADPAAQTPAGVDRVCQTAFLSPTAVDSDKNLTAVRDSLLPDDPAQRAGLLGLYERVLRGRAVSDDRRDPFVERLKLSGVVRSEGGRLRVRNRIYRAVFDRRWVRDNLPDAVRRAEMRARLAGRLQASAVAAVVLVALGVAIWSWRGFERSRDSERALIAIQVNHELGRAESFREEARNIPLNDPEDRKKSMRLWNDARGAAHNAETILATGLANAETQRVVKEQVVALSEEAKAATRDLAMCDRLDKARELRAAITDDDYDRTNPKSNIVFGHAAAGAYEAAFRDDDIDIQNMEPEAAATAIQNRPRIKRQLVAALDDWLALEVDQPIAERLLKVASAADPEDSFRARLRYAVAKGNREGLKQLAREAKQMQLDIPTALLLGDALQLADELNEAIGVLRRAHEAAPSDFWINDILGVYLSSADMSRADEAGRHFAAALARRPNSYFAYNNLGNALIRQCKWQEAKDALQQSFTTSENKFLCAKLSLSQLLDMQGDIAGAIAVCKEILRIRPGSLCATYFLSNYLLEMDDVPQAQKLGQRLCEIAPDHPFTLCCQAALLQRAGDTEQAIKGYRRVLQANPRFTDAHFGLAFSYLKQHQHEDAFRIFRELLARYPKDSSVHEGLAHCYAAQQQWPAAVAAQRTAISLRPAYWGHYLFLGKILFESRATNEAIISLEECIRLNPRSFEAHHQLGLAFFIKDEQLDRAIRVLKKATDLAPANSGLYADLGSVLRVSGRLDEAVLAYQKALELDPNNLVRHAAVNNSRGLILRNKGNIALAIEAFQSATELHPGYTQYWGNLGDTYLTNRQYPEATRAFHEAVRLEKNPWYLTALAMALRGLGKHEDALAAAREALGMKPNHPGALNEFALALKAIGRFDEPITYFRATIDSNQNNSAFYFNYGLALDESGGWEEALAAYQQAIACDERIMKHDQRDFELYYYLGRAQLITGRLQEARKSFETGKAMAEARKIDVSYWISEINLCKRLEDLKPKQLDILAGKVRPKTPKESLEYARFFYYTNQPIPAVEHILRVFKDDPPSLDQLDNRFLASLMALKAAVVSDGQEPVRLRRLALDMLRAQLNYIKKKVEETPALRGDARRDLYKWQNHAGLATVREPTALNNLPRAEREEWLTFWADIRAFLNPPAKLGIAPLPRSVKK